MPGLKWKIYRVFNYILLACSSIIFLFLVRLLFTSTEPDFDPITLLLGFLFLAIIVSCLINITIMSKTFPDKLLNRNQNRWHIFSIILNAAAFAGLFYALISLLKYVGNYDRGDAGGLVVMAAILIILLVLLVFIFVCQLVVKKYLRSKSDVALSSMIDSIGKEN